MSFDCLAPHYGWMERVLAGGVLQRARLCWMESVPIPQRVLLVGEGPGRFLSVAAQVWGGAQFCVVDASARMLDQARRRWRERVGDDGRVVWRRVHLPDQEVGPEGYDLVVTHFFLDCFSEPLLRRVIRGLSAAARRPADWIVSDFGFAEAGWRRLRSRLLLRVMYVFFRRVTGIPAQGWVCPDLLLEAEGFRLRRRRLMNQGLVHADWWQRSAALGG